MSNIHAQTFENQIQIYATNYVIYVAFVVCAPDARLKTTWYFFLFYLLNCLFFAMRNSQTYVLRISMLNAKELSDIAIFSFGFFLSISQIMREARNDGMSNGILEMKQKRI